MQVAIAYSDGHMEIFDSNSLTAGAPFGRSSIITEFHIAWEEGADDVSASTDRIRGPRTVLADPADVALIESVHIDGRLSFWRQGGCLVDARRFELACQKWYVGPSFATTNEKAVWLF